MKLLYAALTLALLSKQALAANPTGDAQAVYRPKRFSFDDILNGKDHESESLLNALQDVGMISVTNMPDSFRDSKKESLAWTHPCAAESMATKEHEFPDGTRRRTMATHTVPGPGGIQKIRHGATAEPCKAFNEASLPFRQGVDTVTRAFASRVSDLLGDSLGSTPLLKTEDGSDFKTVKDVVDSGEHLEHFHSYQGAASLDSKSALRKSDSTIEWHTDQGMFLIFTPGVMVQQANGIPTTDVLDETEGFYIELADGTQTLVHFDHEDDLVIMLGDGVNQYVNPSLKNGGVGRKLRAVPHAMAMPAHAENEARVWYGRMVLPPSSAVHPEHGQSFGTIRKLMIEEKSEEIMSLGCSSPSMHARQLEKESCEEGTLLCWHRCMSNEEFGVSADICADQGLDLWCINPRDQLWDNSHGDWFPGCIDSSTAENATEYPRLPDYPRDNETCSAVSYETFVETNGESYEYKADLMEGGYLMWSVEGDNIKGMLSYDGLFGFTALGFSGFPDGNAMHGAIIMMATPSDTYSPVTGFDFSMEPAVEEYVIDAQDKAFRHWMTPVTSMARQASPVISAADTYQVQETECFTAMTFNTPGIFNTTFNVSGTDELIWAANGEDSFAGYHGMSRGVITVEWATGKVTLDEKREAIKKETGEDDNEGNDHDHADGEDKNALESSGAFALGVSSVLSSLFLAMFWI